MRHRHLRNFCLLGGLGLMLLATVGAGEEAHAGQPDPMRAPAAAKPEPRMSRGTSETAFPALVLDVYLRFFQRVISPVDGARSNMYPTGSAYSRQALARHGALLGLVLTTERLMHEGNEARIAPRIRKYGLWRIYDPVGANDWWWQEPEWVYRPQPGALRR